MNVKIVTKPTSLLTSGNTQLWLDFVSHTRSDNFKFFLCLTECLSVLKFTVDPLTRNCLTFMCCSLHCCWTHTHLTALFPWLPWWAGTRKVKPIWILLKQETVSGSGISWAICKFAPSSRHTMPAPHHSVFYRLDALPADQPTASKHWRHCCWSETQIDCLLIIAQKI